MIISMSGAELPRGPASSIDAASAACSLAPMSIAMPPQTRNRALALPNILTYARVVAVPMVVGFLFWPDEVWARWTALAIFATAGATDFLDGYLARVLSQQSTMGRMLDPIADKLLVAASLLMLVADHTITSWTISAAIVILCREILVSGAARIPRRIESLGAGKPRREMEDDDAAHRHRLPHRRTRGREGVTWHDADRACVAVDRRAADALHWLGLSQGRLEIRSGRSMKAVYFAWVRERIGIADETITPPADVATVADLIAWLSTRGENYAYAFENARTIRAALDRTHAKHDVAIAGAREIAFFPPMTGG